MFTRREWLRGFSDEIYQPTVDGSCPRTGQLWLRIVEVVCVHDFCGPVPEARLRAR